jgi:integrase
MLRTAREWGFTAGTIGAVKLPQSPIDDHARCFTIDEATRIIGESTPPWHALYATAAMTGLRFGELLGLKWDDVDLTRGVLSV